MACQTKENIGFLMEKPQTKVVNSNEEFYFLVYGLNDGYRVVMGLTRHYVDNGKIVYPATACWNSGQIYIVQE